jgi:hypothetical protein
VEQPAKRVAPSRSKVSFFDAPARELPASARSALLRHGCCASWDSPCSGSLTRPASPTPRQPACCGAAMLSGTSGDRGQENGATGLLQWAHL